MCIWEHVTPLVYTSQNNMLLGNTEIVAVGDSSIANQDLLYSNKQLYLF